MPFARGRGQDDRDHRDRAPSTMTMMTTLKTTPQAYCTTNICNNFNSTSPGCPPTIQALYWPLSTTLPCTATSLTMTMMLTMLQQGHLCWKPHLSICWWKSVKNHINTRHRSNKNRNCGSTSNGNFDNSARNNHCNHHHGHHRIISRYITSMSTFLELYKHCLPNIYHSGHGHIKIPHQKQ